MEGSKTFPIYGRQVLAIRHLGFFSETLLFFTDTYSYRIDPVEGPPSRTVCICFYDRCSLSSRLKFPLRFKEAGSFSPVRPA